MRTRSVALPELELRVSLASPTDALVDQLVPAGRIVRRRVLGRVFEIRAGHRDVLRANGLVLAYKAGTSSGLVRMRASILAAAAGSRRTSVRAMGGNRLPLVVLAVGGACPEGRALCETWKTPFVESDSLDAALIELCSAIEAVLPAAAPPGPRFASLESLVSDASQWKPLLHAYPRYCARDALAKLGSAAFKDLWETMYPGEAGGAGYLPPEGLAVGAVAAPVQFLDAEPAQLAAQMALLDSALWRAIPRAELLRWVRKDKAAVAPSVLALVERFNTVSRWVATTLVSERRLAYRVQLVRRIVQVCQHLSSLHDYHSLVAMLAGLDNAAVYRLRRMWAAVPSKTMGTLEELRALVASTGSFKALRAAWRGADAAVVPYVGVFLADVTFIEEGNADHEDGRINVGKLTLLARVVSEFEACQAGRYGHAVDPAVYNLVSNLTSVSDDALYKLSLLAEPRDGDSSSSSGGSGASDAVGAPATESDDAAVARRLETALLNAQQQGALVDLVREWRGLILDESGRWTTAAQALQSSSCLELLVTKLLTQRAAWSEDLEHEVLGLFDEVLLGSRRFHEGLLAGLFAMTRIETPSTSLAQFMRIAGSLKGRLCPPTVSDRMAQANQLIAEVAGTLAQLEQQQPVGVATLTETAERVAGAKQLMRALAGRRSLVLEHAVLPLGLRTLSDLFPADLVAPEAPALPVGPEATIGEAVDAHISAIVAHALTLLVHKAREAIDADVQDMITYRRALDAELVDAVSRTLVRLDSHLLGLREALECGEPASPRMSLESGFYQQLLDDVGEISVTLAAVGCDDPVRADELAQDLQEVVELVDEIGALLDRAQKPS